MRWIMGLAFVLSNVQEAPAAPAPASVAPPACTAPALPGDLRNVTCTLTASGAPQCFRFRVTFLGGHDDTKASIEPALDGRAMTCDAGSKTSLYGEDGEVGLECRFSIRSAAGTTHVFEVTVLWSHAQYKDFAFAEE